MSNSLQEWIDDWQETFQTGYTVEDLQKWVGQTVRISRPDAEESYELDVVGWSQTTVVDEDRSAVQLAIVTASGMMVQLRVGVHIEIAD